MISRITTSELPPEEPFDDDVIEAVGSVEIEAEALPANEASVRRGVEVVRAAWKTLPNSPGVYRMMGEGGDVLYVGKAKSLKKRVASYTRGFGHSNRIARMIAETEGMEFVTTATETEALLLETNFIKQLRPRYNVLMRDDKSFPYILVTKGHRAPQLAKHRGARNRQGDYYGPVRQRRCRRAHDQHAAARLSAALLHRQLFRQSQPALSVVPDQALRRPLYAGNQRRGLCRAGR